MLQSRDDLLQGFSDESADDELENLLRRKLNKSKYFLLMKFFLGSMETKIRPEKISAKENSPDQNKLNSYRVILLNGFPRLAPK